MRGTTRVFAFFIKYRVCLRECVPLSFPPSIGKLHPELFLPLSPMLHNDDRNDRASREPGSHFNVCLPYSLALAQISPHPCSCDLQCPPWLMWRRDRAESRGKGDSLFSFSLHCLSLFMTSPAWPGTRRDPRENVQRTIHRRQWLPRQTQSSAVALWLITKQ